MEYSVEQIKTEDGLVLDGLFCGSKQNKAILFIHGFPGNFGKNIAIASAIAETGFGILSLNTRGHDVLNIIGKNKGGHLVCGSALERFEDCLFDIDAGVNFLKKRGFKNILLAGISSGADKVGYYLSKRPKTSASGGIFISPGSNISVGRRELGKGFNRLLKKADEMIKRGRGGELIINKKMDFPVSYQRFLSLYGENSNENIFPFHNENAEFKILSKIKKPILIAIGDKDKYLFGKKPDEIIKSLKIKLKNSPNNKFIIMKGAPHSFRGKEKQLASEIKSWRI